MTGGVSPSPSQSTLMWACRWLQPTAQRGAQGVQQRSLQLLLTGLFCLVIFVWDQVMSDTKEKQQDGGAQEKTSSGKTHVPCIQNSQGLHILEYSDVHLHWDLYAFNSLHNLLFCAQIIGERGHWRPREPVAVHVCIAFVGWWDVLCTHTHTQIWSPAINTTEERPHTRWKTKGALYVIHHVTCTNYTHVITTNRECSLPLFRHVVWRKQISHKPLQLLLHLLLIKTRSRVKDSHKRRSRRESGGIGREK